MNSLVCNFIEVAKSCFCFNGTLNREKFWTYILILFIPFYLLAMPLLVSGITLLVHFPTTNIWTRLTTYLTFIVGASYLLVSLVYLILSLGPSARRLRDAGLTPWLLILHLIFKPIGPLALIVLFCLPTKVAAEVKQEEKQEVKQEVNQENKQEDKQEDNTAKTETDNTPSEETKA